ncbi:DUF1391 family protein [Escherichia coli]|nr:DUF1391 family protein [Escherichia coli]WQP81817.1 DUF1391 family protein [Escherichia coli]
MSSQIKHSPGNPGRFKTFKTENGARRWLERNSGE